MAQLARPVLRPDTALGRDNISAWTSERPDDTALTISKGECVEQLTERTSSALRNSALAACSVQGQKGLDLSIWRSLLLSGSEQAVLQTTFYRSMITILARVHVLDTTSNARRASTSEGSEVPPLWPNLKLLEQTNQQLPAPQRAAAQAMLLALVQHIVSILNAAPEASNPLTNTQSSAAREPRQRPKWTGGAQRPSGPGAGTQQRPSQQAPWAAMFQTACILPSQDNPRTLLGSSYAAAGGVLTSEEVLLALPYALHLLLHASATAAATSAQAGSATAAPARQGSAIQRAASELQGRGLPPKPRSARSTRSQSDGGVASNGSNTGRPSRPTSNTGAADAPPLPSRASLRQPGGPSARAGAGPSAGEPRRAELPTALVVAAASHLVHRPLIPGTADTPVLLSAVLHGHTAKQGWGSWASKAWQLMPPARLSPESIGPTAWQQLEARYVPSPALVSAASREFQDILDRLHALKAAYDTNPTPEVCEKAVDTSLQAVAFIDSCTAAIRYLDAWRVQHKIQGKVAATAARPAAASSPGSRQGTGPRRQESGVAAEAAGNSTTLPTVGARSRDPSSSGGAADVAPRGAHADQDSKPQPHAASAAQTHSRSAFTDADLVSVLELSSYIVGLQQTLDQFGGWLDGLRRQATGAMLAQMLQNPALRALAELRGPAQLASAGAMTPQASRYTDLGAWSVPAAGAGHGPRPTGSVPVGAIEAALRPPPSPQSPTKSFSVSPGTAWPQREPHSPPPPGPGAISLADGIAQEHLKTAKSTGAGSITAAPSCASPSLAQPRSTGSGQGGSCKGSDIPPSVGSAGTGSRGSSQGGNHGAMGLSTVYEGSTGGAGYQGPSPMKRGWSDGGVPHGRSLASAGGVGFAARADGGQSGGGAGDGASECELPAHTVVVYPVDEDTAAAAGELPPHLDSVYGPLGEPAPHPYELLAGPGELWVQNHHPSAGVSNDLWARSMHRPQQAHDDILRASRAERGPPASSPGRCVSAGTVTSARPYFTDGGDYAGTYSGGAGGGGGVCDTYDMWTQSRNASYIPGPEAADSPAIVAQSGSVGGPAAAAGPPMFWQPRRTGSAAGSVYSGEWRSQASQPSETGEYGDELYDPGENLDWVNQAPMQRMLQMAAAANRAQSGAGGRIGPGPIAEGAESDGDDAALFAVVAAAAARGGPGPVAEGRESTTAAEKAVAKGFKKFLKRAEGAVSRLTTQPDGDKAAAAPAADEAGAPAAATDAAASTPATQQGTDEGPLAGALAPLDTGLAAQQVDAAVTGLPTPTEAAAGAAAGKHAGGKAMKFLNKGLKHINAAATAASAFTERHGRGAGKALQAADAAEPDAAAPPLPELALQPPGGAEPPAAAAAAPSKGMSFAGLRAGKLPKAASAKASAMWDWRKKGKDAAAPTDTAVTQAAEAAEQGPATEAESSAVATEQPAATTPKSPSTAFGKAGPLWKWGKHGKGATVPTDASQPIADTGSEQPVTAAAAAAVPKAEKPSVLWKWGKKDKAGAAAATLPDASPREMAAQPVVVLGGDSTAPGSDAVAPSGGVLGKKLPSWVRSRRAEPAAAATAVPAITAEAAVAGPSVLAVPEPTSHGSALSPVAETGEPSSTASTAQHSAQPASQGAQSGSADDASWGPTSVGAASGLGCLAPSQGVDGVPTSNGFSSVPNSQGVDSVPTSQGAGVMGELGGKAREALFRFMRELEANAQTTAAAGGAGAADLPADVTAAAADSPDEAADTDRVPASSPALPHPESHPSGVLTRTTHVSEITLDVGVGAEGQGPGVVHPTAVADSAATAAAEPATFATGQPDGMAASGVSSGLGLVSDTTVSGQETAATAAAAAAVPPLAMRVTSAGGAAAPCSPRGTSVQAAATAAAAGVLRRVRTMFNRRKPPLTPATTEATKPSPLGMPLRASQLRRSTGSPLTSAGGVSKPAAEGPLRMGLRRQSGGGADGLRRQTSRSSAGSRAAQNAAPPGSTCATPEPAAAAAAATVDAGADAGANAPKPFTVPTIVVPGSTEKAMSERFDDDDGEAVLPPPPAVSAAMQGAASAAGGLAGTANFWARAWRVKSAKPGQNPPTHAELAEQTGARAATFAAMGAPLTSRLAARQPVLPPQAPFTPAGRSPALGIAEASAVLMLEAGKMQLAAKAQIVLDELQACLSQPHPAAAPAPTLRLELALQMAGAQAAQLAARVRVQIAKAAVAPHGKTYLQEQGLHRLQSHIEQLMELCKTAESALPHARAIASCTARLSTCNTALASLMLTARAPQPAAPAAPAEQPDSSVTLATALPTASLPPLPRAPVAKGHADTAGSSGSSGGDASQTAAAVPAPAADASGKARTATLEGSPAAAKAAAVAAAAAVSASPPPPSAWAGAVDLQVLRQLCSTAVSLSAARRLPATFVLLPARLLDSLRALCAATGGPSAADAPTAANIAGLLSHAMPALAGALWSSHVSLASLGADGASARITLPFEPASIAQYQPLLDTREITVAGCKIDVRRALLTALVGVIRDSARSCADKARAEAPEGVGLAALSARVATYDRAVELLREQLPVLPSWQRVWQAALSSTSTSKAALLLPTAPQQTLPRTQLRDTQGVKDTASGLLGTAQTLGVDAARWRLDLTGLQLFCAPQLSQQGNATGTAEVAQPSTPAAVVPMSSPFRPPVAQSYQGPSMDALAAAGAAAAARRAPAGVRSEGGGRMPTTPEPAAPSARVPRFVPAADQSDAVTAAGFMPQADAGAQQCLTLEDLAALSALAHSCSGGAGTAEGLDQFMLNTQQDSAALLHGAVLPRLAALMQSLAPAPAPAEGAAAAARRRAPRETKYVEDACPAGSAPMSDAESLGGELSEAVKRAPEGQWEACIAALHAFGIQVAKVVAADAARARQRVESGSWCASHLGLTTACSGPTHDTDSYPPLQGTPPASQGGATQQPAQTTAVDGEGPVQELNGSSGAVTAGPGQGQGRGAGALPPMPEPPSRPCFVTTEASKPAAIRARILGSSLPALHGGVTPAINLTHSTVVSASVPSAQSSDALHTAADLLALDAWQRMQPNSCMAQYWAHLQQVLSAGCKTALASLTRPLSGTGRASEAGSSTDNTVCSAESSVVDVVGAQQETPAAPATAEAVPVPVFDERTVARSCCHVVTYLYVGRTEKATGDMGGVLFGAAVLLHLTGYEQQQPLMHHLQTLLATATLQSASAATTDTRTATTAATSGWKGTPPSRGKATDTRQYGRRISGGGGAAAPRAPRAVVVSMAAAARIMADWEVACCHAACLKTSHATWSVAPAPAAAGAEQASLAAVAAAASQESAPDQMWLPAPPVGGMQGLFGAEHTAGMGRGGNGPMQAKMRAAAWGYQDDWKLRPMAPNESVHVCASLSDLRVRDQSLLDMATDA